MGKRRRGKRTGRRAWFKPFSRKNQSQPNAYGIGVLYGKKSIPLDNELRNIWIADGLDYSRETLLTIQELRKEWIVEHRSKYNTIVPLAILLSGRYIKQILFGTGSSFYFFRWIYNSTDRSLRNIVRSTEMHSREEAYDCFFQRNNRTIVWEHIVYPSE